jgi:hypothetical protein
MRLIFDFRCPDNHVTEALVASDETEHTCGLCNKIATRIISPVRCSLDPICGDFVGATMKWAKQREQKIKLERKANSE